MHLLYSRIIGVKERLDFVLAFWMVHEVRDPGSLLQEIYAALRPGAMLLVVEPIIHVLAGKFERSVESAKQVGFTAAGQPRVRISRAVLLERPRAA